MRLQACGASGLLFSYLATAATQLCSHVSQRYLPPAIAAITTLRILDLGTETGGQVGFSWLSSWLAQERPDLHIVEDFYYH